ncbi:hypothetical protein B1R32_10882 [Abditibacterium utsteinense]|uniref:Uncharacterized protein n=1 Tax=Abditibacterium utsteinense TaxID=1960156 RepID=A0A2S8SSW0_9BACT|nr:hypothetical protein [Abditibacterium utsteinense]PQV63875.1 hypothetical protein B1R32_10882 [Abditibacterium utsteinense]
MRVYSPDRDAIFTKAPKAALQIGGFPDFYALLGIEPTANRAALENAITSRAADLLAASFSRGGKSESLILLEEHITDFRPVLLDKVTRLAYDEQLRRHQIGDARALPFAHWKVEFAAQNRIARGFKTASLDFKARIRAAFWDSEYF